jgi:hypothetical protein
MKTYSGIGLLVISLLVLLSNMSDEVSHLSNWHDSTTPQFVAVLLKQIGATVSAAIGGSLLPQLGNKQ